MSRAPLTPGPDGVVRLSGGNPQIPKGEGDGPVQAFIAAMPGWQVAVGRRLDRLIAEAVPGACRAVKWNTPLFGAPGDEGFFMGFHCFAAYVKVSFFRGAHLVPPPPGASKQKDVRYLDIREDDATPDAQLLDWIAQAARLPGERM
jgi:hypothetical protein